MNGPVVLRRAGAAALVVAALALGQVVRTSLPADPLIAAPYERAGVVGEPVAMRYATVEATGVEGSTVVDSGGSLLTTPGVWVVVPLTVTAHGEPRRLGYAAVRTADGRLFRADGDRSSFETGTVQAGLSRSATLAVELPVEAAAGAELLLALDPMTDTRRDDMAVIDLGITGDLAQEWAARADPLPVPPSADTAVASS